jgi:hypothetical protein
MPRGLPLIIISSWLIITPLVLTGSIFLYTKTSHTGLVLGARSSPDALFTAQPPILGGISQSIKSGDARALLVEKFLHKYHSPMQGNGAFFVEMADQYKVDWRLVAAIAFQESTLGKAMPKGSFNAWGWAVFTGKESGTKFTSWQDAIEKVTRGIARDYYSRGLRTPTQIQTRYTPDSNGSWAEAVQFAMEDIED